MRTFINFLGLVGLLVSPALMASPYPNSGSLYFDVREDRLSRVKRKDGPQVTPVESAAQEFSSEPMAVSHFVVYGNKSLEDELIASVLAPFSHRTLTPEQLSKAATSLRDAYRTAGFFLAQVYIPPQAIENGIVTLHVYEGFLEMNGVELDDARGDQINTSVVQQTLTEQLVTGTPLHRSEVERSILLVDDLPGITSHSIIYPGEEVGSARLLVRTENTPSVTGNIDIDNFGNYYTGEERLGATVYFNSLAGMGDQLTFRGVASGSGSNYAYIDYSAPLGGDGWRIGANADYLRYEVGKELSELESDGSAASVRVFASYPIVRSRHHNHSVRAEYSYLDIKDDGANGQLLAERNIHSLSLWLMGDLDHDRLANGITFYSASLTSGSLDITGGQAFVDFDRAKSGADGSFTRLNAEASRLQHLSGPWSVYGAIAGQWATGNMDTSQKFYIGGPFRVAGYPTGEASGDQGANFHADLRYDFEKTLLGGYLQLSFFYAAGWAQLHKNPWEGWEGSNPIIKNDITLQSWGVGMTQSWGSSLSLRAYLGRQLGSNESRDPMTGLDSDQTDSSYRGWAQVIYYF